MKKRRMFMIKIEVKGDDMVSLSMEGEVTEIVAELGAVIGAMYNDIRSVSPNAAEAFRNMVLFATLPSSPIWEKYEVSGGVRQVVTVPKPRKAGGE
jgi:hypothetical protein